MEKNEKLVLIFLGIIILSILLPIFIFIIGIDISSSFLVIYSISIPLVHLALSISGIVYSIKLIRQKRLGFGITFLVLFSIIILFHLLITFLGFMIGLSRIIYF